MVVYEQRVNYLIATVLLATNMHMLKADYVLEVQVERYFNVPHTRDDGFCCEVPRDAVCADDCDNRFLFCLQTHNIPVGSEVCPLGNYSTGVVSGDSMVFNVGQDLEEGVPNPLLFTGPRWPGSVQLHVRVDDVDPSTGLDAGDDLVTQFSTGLVNLSISTGFVVGDYIGGNSIGLLRLSYRVTCTENFYGSDCATLCVERDDELGHYTCDSEGNIVCREGFQNPSTNCTECILAEGCSPVGGHCSDSDSCICNVRYTGDNCTIDLDPCGHTAPCENGATCSNTGPDQYECLCTAGFEGDSCERETDECDPNPCRNGGSCQDLLADYMCLCLDSFSGRDCGNQGSPGSGSGLGAVTGGAVAAVLLLVVIVVLIVILVAVLRRKRAATHTTVADKGSTPKGFRIENPTYGGGDDVHLQSTNTNSYTTIGSTNRASHHSTRATPRDPTQDESEFPPQNLSASETAYYSSVPVEEVTEASKAVTSDVYYSSVPVEEMTETSTPEVYYSVPVKDLQEPPVSSSSTMEPGAEGFRYEYVRMGSTASISTSLSQHDSAEGASVAKQKGSLCYHAEGDGGEDPTLHFYDYPILPKNPRAHLQPYEYESPGSTAREHQFPVADTDPSAHYEFDK